MGFTFATKVNAEDRAMGLAPASARVLADMPFRTRVFAAGGCHLYFARGVTFLSCADSERLRIQEL
jgi:hypothetical protein